MIKVYLRYVIKKMSWLLPNHLIWFLCKQIAVYQPEPINWPGWKLGAGQDSKKINILVRKFFWELTSYRADMKPFSINWHKRLKVFIYPKEDNSRSVFLTGFYEPNSLLTIQKFISEGMTVIDVGAHMGLYTLFLSNLVGNNGLVLAIEPSQREFIHLQSNLQLNKISNVRYENIALLDHSTMANLFVADVKHSGHNTFGTFISDNTKLERVQRVKTIRLDDITDSHNLKKVDFIKIDVEGAEVYVLRGAKATLRKFRPILLIEVQSKSLRSQNCIPQDIWDLLESLGYRMYRYDAMRECLVLAKGPLSENKKENIFAYHPKSHFPNFLRYISSDPSMSGDLLQISR